MLMRTGLCSYGQSIAHFGGQPRSQISAELRTSANNLLTSFNENIQTHLVALSNVAHQLTGMADRILTRHLAGAIKAEVAMREAMLTQAQEISSLESHLRMLAGRLYHSPAFYEIQSLSRDVQRHFWRSDEITSKGLRPGYDTRS
jgi:hypothetical protein